MADFEFLTSFIALKVNRQSFNTALAEFRKLETEVNAIIARINAKVIKSPVLGGKGGVGGKKKKTPLGTATPAQLKSLKSEVTSTTSSIENVFSQIARRGVKPFNDSLKRSKEQLRKLRNDFRLAYESKQLVPTQAALEKIIDLENRLRERLQKARAASRARSEDARKAAQIEAQLAKTRGQNAERISQEAIATQKLAIARQNAFRRIAGTNAFGRTLARISGFLKALIIDFKTLSIGARVAAAAMRALNTAIDLLLGGVIALSKAFITLPLRGVALGINLIKTAVKGLLSPLISVSRAFKFFSRSIFPFLGFGLLTLGLRNAVSEFASFEENVARSLDLAAKSQRDFAGQNRELFIQVQKKLRDVARETIFTAEEVANTFNLLVRGGLELEEALASIKPTVDLAIATRGTPEDAAQLINVLRNQFGLVRDGARQATFTVEEYNKAVGDLADTLVFATKSAPVDIKGFRVALEQTGEVAAQVGLTLEETTSLLIRLFEGLPAPSKVGTGLSRAIVRALKPTEAGLKRIDSALAGTGKNLDDFFEGQKFKPGGFVELIEELQKAGVGIGGLVDIFGFRTRAVARLFAEFEGGTNTFKKYVDSLKKAQKENLAQAIADDIAQNTLFGSLKLLRSEFAELKTSIFNNLINLGLVDFIRRIRDGVRSVSVFVANFKTFENAIGGIREAFKNIGDAAAQALKPIANFLLVFNAAVLAAGLGLAEAAFNRLGEVASGVAIALQDVANAIGVQDAFTAIGGAIEAATVLLINYRKAFRAAVLAGYIAVLKATIAIRDFLKEKGFFESIFSTLKSAFNTLLSLLQVGGRAVGAAIGKGVGDSLKAELSSIPLIGGFIGKSLEGTDERITRLNKELRTSESLLNLFTNKLKSLEQEQKFIGKAKPGFFGFLGDIARELTGVEFFAKSEIKAEIKATEKRIAKLKKTIAQDKITLAELDPVGAVAEKAVADAKKLFSEFLGGDFAKQFTGLNLTEQLEEALELLKEIPKEFKSLDKEQRKSLNTLRERLTEALRIERFFDDALKGQGGDTKIRFLGLEEFGRLINTAFDPTVDTTGDKIDHGNTILTSIDTGINLLNDTMNDIRSRGGLGARVLRGAEKASPYAQPLLPTVLSYLFPHTIT